MVSSHGEIRRSWSARAHCSARPCKIPISRVGIGIANVTFTRADATDTVRTPVFVSFGNDIPLLSYEELLNQLRYYVAPDRLKRLRDAPVEQRGVMLGRVPAVRATLRLPHRSMKAFRLILRGFSRPPSISR